MTTAHCPQPKVLPHKPASRPAATRRAVWINEDNAHLYDQHPPERMTEAGIRGIVRGYVEGTGVAGLLLCVNVQRALFDSRVWEPLWDGYEPDGPDDQPLIRSLSPKARSLTPDQRGRYWIHNLHLLHQRGVDHPAIWLDECRRLGVDGWLTMRMNDCHHNDDPDSFWHPTLWKTRPDLRRCPRRDGDWFEDAFDYAQPEVYEHHMALVRELTERYDFDGLELDWVRWVRHFKPGHEQAGMPILTRFMREARALVDAAATRQGRKVRLGVRLPSQPQACLDFGYDVVTWAREGLMDLVTLAPFFQQAEYDWPVKLWRGILGTKVELLCQPESTLRPYPEVGQKELMLDYPLLFGSAASALQRGADGIYLFNECYRVAPGDRFAAADPKLLENLFTRAGTLEGVRELPRRQVASYAQIVGPGAGSGSALPVELSKPADSWSFARHGEVISVRLFQGGLPRESSLRLEVGFDVDALEADIPVWLNSHLLTQTAEPLSLNRPGSVRSVRSYDVPRGVALDDVNLVDLLPPAGTPGRLVWAELIVGSPNAR